MAVVELTLFLTGVPVALPFVVWLSAPGEVDPTVEVTLVRALETTGEVLAEPAGDLAANVSRRRA